MGEGLSTTCHGVGRPHGIPHLSEDLYTDDGGVVGLLFSCHISSCTQTPTHTLVNNLGNTHWVTHTKTWTWKGSYLGRGKELVEVERIREGIGGVVNMIKLYYVQV